MSMKEMRQKKEMQNREGNKNIIVLSPTYRKRRNVYRHIDLCQYDLYSPLYRLSRITGYCELGTQVMR